jgi:hydrogenase nickel incorporation protein HypA/HybF
MHELSVAIELYNGLRDELESLGGGRLREVSVALGELAAIEPDLLRFAWQAVTEAGPDAGAQLKLDWHPVTQLCPSCGPLEQRASGSWMRLCPTCDELLLLEGGHELSITSFAYDELHSSQSGSPAASVPEKCSP